MTNAQKWVAGFLLLFVLLLALSKMTERGESKTDSYDEVEVETTQTAPKDINAENLLANNRCFICHGVDLAGSGMGPSLAEVGDNWNQENLVSYLKNPAAFLGDQRMVVLKEKYNRDMPALQNLSEEELNVLAEHLINR
jgi:cytochrome c2